MQRVKIYHSLVVLYKNTPRPESKLCGPDFDDNYWARLNIINEPSQEVCRRTKPTYNISRSIALFLTRISPSARDCSMTWLLQLPCNPLRSITRVQVTMTSVLPCP